MIAKETIIQAFKEQFNQEPTTIVKSPGRINIIGEHTDYNQGFVMPAAIDQYIYVAVSARNDNELHLYSADYKENYQTVLNQDLTNAPDWSKYIIGVSEIIQAKTSKINGFNAYVVGDVPLGAGLSSSAAFSSAIGFALNELFQIGLSRVDLAKVGQQTEHDYVGVKCGIMDQFASIMGKDNHAIQLDCRDLSFDYVPLDWEDYEILLLNTNVKHNLASSAYNDRRAACEQAVNWIKEQYSSVESLRDVTVEQLEEFVLPKSQDVYTKSRFVVEENDRVTKANIALKNHEFDALGRLLFEAHWALSKQYEVSCDELDFLIENVQKIPEVIGARMMGGGFGGCTINIIKKGNRDQVIEKITPLYKAKFGFEPTALKVSIGNGTSFVD
ncbi:galactokinase [Empedobacter falsenii]